MPDQYNGGVQTLMKEHYNLMPFLITATEKENWRRKTFYRIISTFIINLKSRFYWKLIISQLFR
jgi:hypothetical protein